MKFTGKVVETVKNLGTIEGFKMLMESYGIILSEEELNQYFNEIMNSENEMTEGELADEELDNVAGGCGSGDQWLNAKDCIGKNIKEISSGKIGVCYDYSIREAVCSGSHETTWLHCRTASGNEFTVRNAPAQRIILY